MKLIAPLLLLFGIAACSSGSLGYPTAGPDSVLSPIPEIPYADSRGLGYFSIITEPERQCFRDVLGSDNYNKMLNGQGLTISNDQADKIGRCDTLLTLARIDMGEIIAHSPKLSQPTIACLNGMLADAERVGKAQGWDKPRPEGGANIDGDFWPSVSGKEPADCLNLEERAAYEAAKS